MTDAPELHLPVAGLSDDMPLTFHVMDGEGIIRRVSDDWLGRLGYDRGAVVGRPCAAFLTDGSAAALRARLAGGGRRATGGELRCDFLRRDGGVAGCTVWTQALEDRRGRPGGILAILGADADGADIVERLRLKSDQLQSCLEGTNAGTWEWNVQTGETRFNERWAEIIGYTLAELGPVSIGTWQVHAHPDDLDRSAAALRDHWAGRTAFYDIEVRMRHKQGHWVWVHDRGRVFSRTDDGRPEWMFGTHLLVDDQKKREREAESMQRLLRRTGEVAGIGGWEFDLETGALSWTDETRRIHGVADDYVPNLAEAIDFYAPEARAEVTAAVERAMAEGVPWDMELPFLRKSGERIWVRAVGEVEVENGRPRRLFGAFQDITERQRRSEQLARADEAAKQAQDRLWAAIEALPQAFILFDAEDRVVMFNTRYRELYAETGGAIEVGESFEEILRAGLRRGQYPDAVGREEAWLAERLAQHRNPNGPIEQELPNDRHLMIHEVRLPNGDALGVRVDVTELKRQRRDLAEKARALEVAATTDPLTGLMNRRGLELAMRRCAATACAGARFGLLHVDLDRFKPINDVFGHTAGDFLLRRVAEILQRHVRDGDVMARVGGDEFVVVLNAPCDEADACRIAERFIRHCNEPIAWQDKTLHFGASVGIALGAAAELPTMLNDADIALYEAKSGGRNRPHVFNAELRQRLEDRKALSDDLLAGLQRGEIVAHFQPQVSARDHAMVGLEALARWHHPQRGLIGPAQFLGIAEDLGVICEVDRQVCDHAIETAQALVAAGHALGKVSMNAGLRRLTQSPDFDWLPATESLPFGVGLEILEAVDVDRDFDELSWVFDGLRDRGVAIELDDFGSGRASLISLLKIRPDRIKLDIRIVRAAELDQAGAGSMVRAIAEMCRGLGIPMTAEGVETAAQAALMRDIGCDILQGFHFARPLARDDLMAWVRTRSGRHRAVPGSR